MRVALLTQNARAGDAVGRQVAEKVGALRERGADVCVIVSDDADLHPAVRPFAIKSSGRDEALTAARRADLVIVEYSQYYPLLELLPLLADGRRKILLNYYGVTPAAMCPYNQRELALLGREWRGLAGFADLVITHSDFTSKELLHAVSLSDKRLKCMGLPFDNEWFSTQQSDVPLCDRLNLGDAIVLLFVGRLAPNKRLSVAIRALAELKNERPPVHLAVVGPSGGCYETERLLCREIAADLGVQDRLHFLGEVDEVTLLDCYRGAEVLVMPSVHEGFSLPVVEAMACGLPVVAARLTAVPETLDGAGLLFAPDEPLDLARQLRRVLSNAATHVDGAIAIVTPAFGLKFGGAERSLTQLAEGLHAAGRKVEVFAIHADADAHPPFPVYTFAANEVDPGRRAAAIESAGASNEPAFWQNSLRSDALIAALAARKPFEAVIVGPCLTTLARDVVARFGRRAILMPCLHDEPAVHFSGVCTVFESAGGVLFHSEDEKHLAVVELGMSAPNNAVIGAYVDMTAATDGEDMDGRLSGRRYLAFVGRWIAEKNLPLLFEFARRYSLENPGRFAFVFVGSGEITIPDESWAVPLGRLGEAQKWKTVQRADALVQLSVNESLSLVAIEANALRVPVIAHADCKVLNHYVERSGGGYAVSNYPEFAKVLDEVWIDPEAAKCKGNAGQEFVRENFANIARPTAVAETVIANLRRPVAEIVREHGIARAVQYQRPRWRREFEEVIEQTMELPSAVRPAEIEIRSREDCVAGNTWLVTLHHGGGVPLVPTGPGRTDLWVRCRNADGDIVGEPWCVALREVVAAGNDVNLTLPLRQGRFSGNLWLEPGMRTCSDQEKAQVLWLGPTAQWNATAADEHSSSRIVPTAFRQALEKAEVIAQLPAGYVDVTAGRFARWKRWIKSALLHNFRVAYVEVLARQQTRFNHRILDAIAESSVNSSPVHDAALLAELAEVRNRLELLEFKIRELEPATAESREAA